MKRTERNTKKKNDTSLFKLGIIDYDRQQFWDHYDILRIKAIPSSKMNRYTGPRDTDEKVSRFGILKKFFNL